MQRKNTKENCRSGVTLTLNVGQATPDRNKLLIQRQVSPDLQTANDWMFLPKHCQAKPDLPEFQHGGFTLIELLVVVLIIGILAAVALPQYQKAVEKARAAEAVTLVRVMGNAATAYHIANGEYTDDIESLGIDIPGEIITDYNYGTNAVKTKNFICRAASASDGAFSKAIVYCNRSPYSQFYGIGQLEDGKFFCYGYSSFGTKICQGFGTVEVDVGTGHIGYAFN